MTEETFMNRWRRRKWEPNLAAARYDGLEPIVLITGGSEGIGLALAHEFARAGHDLLLVARDPSKLEMAARELARQHDVQIETHYTDLISQENRRAIESHAAGLGRYVDILVNAAGTGLSGPFTSHGTKDVLDLIELNINALTDLCRRLLPGMVARGRGGILNVASLGGLVPGPNQAAYYASKAYVISLSSALAEEVSGMGVRVTALAPGAAATKFHERMGAENSLYLRFFGVMSPEKIAQSGYRGFNNWLRLVVPGILHKINAVALKLAPHRVMVPFMAFLLKRPGQGEPGAETD